VLLLQRRGRSCRPEGKNDGGGSFSCRKGESWGQEGGGAEKRLFSCWERKRATEPTERKGGRPQLKNKFYPGRKGGGLRKKKTTIRGKGKWSTRRGSQGGKKEKKEKVAVYPKRKKKGPDKCGGRGGPHRIAD